MILKYDAFHTFEINFNGTNEKLEPRTLVCFQSDWLLIHIVLFSYSHKLNFYSHKEFAIVSIYLTFSNTKAISCWIRAFKSMQKWITKVNCSNFFLPIYKNISLKVRIWRTIFSHSRLRIVSEDGYMVELETSFYEGQKSSTAKS